MNRFIGARRRGISVLRVLGLVVLLIVVPVSMGFSQTKPSGLRIVSAQPQTPLTGSYGIISASRTSGVAPLSVHFSADFSSDPEGGRGFHAYDYTWDFGDSGSGTWGTTGKSKNSAKGAVAAHVFEEGGRVYLVTLTVRGKDGVVGTEYFHISVDDPDEYYAGSKTVCVNPVGDTDFSAKPFGALEVYAPVNDLSSVTQYATAGRRILFKRGASWTTAGLTWPNNGGPVTIGAYGTGTSPDALGLYDNAPNISVTSGIFLQLNNKQDWRITDIEFSGPAVAGQTVGFISGEWRFQRMLFYKLRITGFNAASFGWTHWIDPGTPQIDQMALVSCSLSGGYDYIGFIGGERLAVLGSILKNPLNSHVLRVWQAYKSVISNNMLSGSSLNSSTGRLAMKLHGPSEELIASTTATHLDNRTEYTIVSDNVFGTSGPWPVGISPQDDGTDERLTNIIFERNRYVGDFGDKSAASPALSAAILVSGKRITVRNNIIDGSNYGTGSFTGIWCMRSQTAPAPEDIWVYNNTIYKPGTSTSNWVGVKVAAEIASTVIRNNVVAFPGKAGVKLIVDDLGTGTIQTNNLLNGAVVFVDPSNASPLLRDFSLAGGSADAIDKGYNISTVAEDFLGTARYRGAGMDIGAFESY